MQRSLTLIDVPKDGRPHDVAPAPDGSVWYTAQRQAALGRLDLATQAWQTCELPGETPRAYSISVDENDIVWLTDRTANAVVRSEPKSEELQGFPSDRASANVRQMLGRTGEVWGAESGVNRLVVISTSGTGS